MTEEIITTRSDEEVFKDHINNLYQLFDPERAHPQQDLILFSKQKIPALFVLLSFIINTRKLVELDNITDEFIHRIMLSFTEKENQQHLDKLISLDKQIKTCCFGGKPFKESALFLNIWNEILEHFIEIENIPNVDSQIEELVQKTHDLNID